MRKVITTENIKPLIKESLSEMIRDNEEGIREMLKEAIEDIALANAVKEGRKNDYVSERKILKMLDK